MQSRSEAATKYTYNPEENTWHSQPTRVVVDSKPFAEGGMRVCLKLYELEDNGDFIPCVAKIFKTDPGQKFYFDEALAQMTAECFAQRFNEVAHRTKIAFLPVSVMVLEERNGQLCNVEPMMSGNYVKHNDNNGHVATQIAVPQTFSHWTWEASDHTLVVCDIQGVSDCYTDPQIHSLDGFSFGQGNLGQSGVIKFFQTHKCNALCGVLGLPPTHKTVAEWQVRQRLSQIEQLSANGTPTTQSPRGGDNFRAAAELDGARSSLSAAAGASVASGRQSPASPFTLLLQQGGLSRDEQRKRQNAAQFLANRTSSLSPPKNSTRRAGARDSPIAAMLARSGSPLPAGRHGLEAAGGRR